MEESNIQNQSQASMTDSNNEKPSCPYQPGACVGCGKTTEPFYREPVMLGKTELAGQWFPADEKCAECVKKEEQEEVEKRNPKVRLIHSGFSILHLAMSFDNYQITTENEKALNIALQYFKDRLNGGLFISGPCGVGKTHLAASVARELIFLGKKCRFVSVPELLVKIRSVFSGQTDKTEEDFIEEYAKYEYLVMDDLGAEKVTEWSLEILYLLIDKRLRDLKHGLIITSNYELSEISERLNDRIASRIAEMCRLIKLEGKDWRLKRRGRK